MTIYHITTRKEWTQAQESGVYKGDTLQIEGFIHCSTREQFIQVANLRFTSRQDLILLCINPDRIDAVIRYENLEGGTDLYPHIYGPLNTTAVLQAIEFHPSADGIFQRPIDLP